MIINTTILSWVTFIYFGSATFYIFKMVTGKEFWGPLASVIAFIGLIAQTVGLILRWFESYKMGIGHAPLSNLYESLIFFSWTIVLLYLIIEWRIKSRNLGAFVIPFAFLSMAFASLSVKSGIQPLIPALQSNWLISHVITCFFGYAAFTIACGLGFMYLLRGLTNLNLFSMQGRLNRLKYFHLSLIILIVTLGVTLSLTLIIIGILPKISGVFSWALRSAIILTVLILFILLTLVSAFQRVKRLHDLGRPGTHFWLLLVPLYNIYLESVLFFKKGTGRANQYGPPDEYGDETTTGLLGALPAQVIIDELTYHSVVIGFIFLTLGIITGSVWAYSAWGSYWSWDPKETWSLITWLIYAAMLHSRFVRGWRGKRMAIMSIIGLE
jgi:cytochrome c-type biogenesis protein CcsB